MLGALLLAGVLAAPRAPASDAEVFHGWSRDGSWLVYEVHGANELVELYFCATSPDETPSWPRVLNEADRESMPGLSCVHFLDPNKAPWQWKAQLQLPAPAPRYLGVEVSKEELSTDGENPGFTLVAGDRRQACYASGIREDSRLQKTWFHPSGRFAAALIDGRFHHCVVELRGAPPPRPPAPRPPPKKK